MSARAQRLARRSDDPFFSTGNYISHRDDESVIYLYNDGNDNDEQSDHGNNESSWRNHNDDDDDDDDDDGYPCPAPECHMTFESLTSMEHHYQINHSFECSVCQKVFQNNHLLDLHVEEIHDNYFAMALSRGRTTYRCLIATCPVTFVDDKQRHDHLRAMHGYPRWFRFHPKIDDEVLLRDLTRRLRWSTKGRRNNDRRRGRNRVRETNDDGSGDDEEELQLQQHQEQQRRRAVRKERQKAKRKRVKCHFFFSEGGCFRGERCRFSHDDGLAKGHGSNDDEGDAVMENLVDDLNKKGCVTVPEDISFGRKGHRVLL